MDFVELNADQRREAINTSQRFQAHREAMARVRDSRGSMVWSTTKGHEYLLRSSYDKKGRRRQTSLGPRSAETEQIKLAFDRARAEATSRLQHSQLLIERQSAVNRALALGRVPLLGARIIRMLDANGLLGAGIRILGTNALYAFEAVAGVRLDAGLTTTEDVDLLLDARQHLAVAATEEVEETSLLRLLHRVDKSFERAPQAFRASNRDGYLVDLIKPLRNPPWTREAQGIGNDPSDLAAVEIEGLAWHESAPAFEAVAIDERGEPLRMVTTDPRVWAAHKLWLSKRHDREPIKRRRDADQARAVASLVATHFPHLPFEGDDLKMIPREVFDQAKPLFVGPQA